MFDLFRSREKSVRIMLGAILGVVALSMVTYLIPGSGGAPLAGDDNVLARIGNERITTQSAFQAVSMAMKGRQYPAEMRGFIAPQVIEGLINERAMAYEAKRLGIQVSDDDVSDAIRKQLPAGFLDKDGNVNQDMLGQALAAENLTVPQFIEETKRSLLVSRLRQVVDSGVVITKSDLEREYKRRNEKIKIEYALIKPASLDQQVQVTPAEVEAYFNKNRQSYQTPEKRSLAIVILDPVKVGQTINPSDAELQNVYNSGLDRFRTPERVKVRHILIPTDASTTDAQTQAKAADVLSQIKSGADFGELAKKYSKDPGSSSKGGDVGFISRGQMVKPFEDSAFSLKPGELSGLVKTTYGYHILQVLAKEDARVKPFAEVKEQLAGEYRTRKGSDLIAQLSDRAVSDLKKDPQHPEKAAQAAHGELLHAENLKPGDPFPQIGPSRDLENAIGGLKAGGVTPPVTVPGNRLAIAEITGDVPAHSANLDEVRSQVEATVRRQKLDDLVQRRAGDLAAQAKAKGNDLAGAAKEMGLEVKQSGDINRQGAVEGFGSASLLGEAFSAKDSAIIGPLSSADGKAVVKVMSHTPADMASYIIQQFPLRDELKNKISRERLLLFEEGVRKQLEKEGKIKVQQDALNRLLQGMRG